MTSIKAKMNKDRAEYDGLSTEDAVAAMLAHPERPVLVIAKLDVVAIEHNVLSGVRTPKVANRHVEILTGENAEAGVRMLEKIYSERTGRAAPPAGLFDTPIEGQEDPAASAPEDATEAPAKRSTRNKLKVETE